uniref:Calcineurin-like phosphoesterase domain-containing protein n=1 Tax=Odontella aurita TaxID=265563 RepID=A0A6U6EID9_9STRA|mmetsp:Transcript_26326/g.77837  ORF Transcript_26326/g.77837 Transcript_26326/m.77837 type:complete len:433 (+) Transcript_26326:245-1543(+)
MSKFWATGSQSSSSDDSTFDDASCTDSDRTVGSLGYSSFEIAEDEPPEASCRQLESFNESFRAISIDTSEVTASPARPPTLPVDDTRVAWARARHTQNFVPPQRRSGPPDPTRYTRIACISDTHGYHKNIAVPNCDILIHGGDFTNFGEPEMVEDTSRYFAELQRGERGARVGSVVCIAGNHELTFQPEHYEKVWRQFHHPESGPYDCQRAREALNNCTYLEDESYTAKNGIKVYGSPWQPEFHRWAFNLPRTEIGDKWRAIPDDTDVLVTHGPPLGRGDRTGDGQRVGCLELMRQIQGHVRPRLHVFGHVHESYGVSSDGTTLYVNASSVGRDYEKHNPCIVVDLPHDPSIPAVLVEPSSSMQQDDIREWLRQNGHERLVPFFERQEVSADFLVKPDNFGEVCCVLGLHRSAKAVADLKAALMDLRAFMYG